MLPPESAVSLNQSGHDARSVLNRQANMLDPNIFQLAVDEGRIIVTENFGDFSALLARRLSSGQPCVPVVFVHKLDFGSGSALATRLALAHNAWTRVNDPPYIGPHWLQP